MQQILDITKKYLAHSIVVLCVAFVFLLVQPTQTHAQFGGLLACQSFNLSLDRVPIQDNSTDVMKNNECIWNGLAWAVAKVTLQHITASVVNWINTGFEGSPSFITNPSAFFADAADQVTGAFIAKTGVLAELCSPFSLDIRLSLALAGQTSYRERYACTLSTIVGNAQSAINSGVNVSVTQGPGGATLGDFISGDIANDPYALDVNGRSINNFMGNFNQGGWPAFLAMTTQPQNNVYGAYLLARSDLEHQISTQQNNINQDLNRGRGFLSWQKCTDVETVNDLDPLDASDAAEYYARAGYKSKRNKDGTTTYQKCDVQTPGSVIAGSLDKTLSSGQDQLNIADSINEIVGALFSQLVTQVLSRGLQTASSRGGVNYNAGIASQLVAERELGYITPVQKQISLELVRNEENVQKLISLRERAVHAFQPTHAEYQKARACFEAKASQPGLRALAESGIQRTRASETRVNSIIAERQATLSKAQGKLAATQAALRDVANAQTTSELMEIKYRFDQASPDDPTSSNIFVSSQEITAAEADLKNSEEEATSLAAEARRLEQQCIELI